MNGRLMIVDDEPEIRDMLSRHFRLLGYEVTTAVNGIDALKVLQNNVIDVVISDIMMPVMSGTLLLREIRTQYPMIRVIMITGYVTLENALECMRHQAETCIFKPLNDLSELQTAVDSAMENLKRWKRKFIELQGMRPLGGVT